VKKIYVLAMVLLLAAVVALPGAAQSAMWVGGELGANFIGSNDVKINDVGPGFNDTIKFKGANFEPSVIGGLTVGYDFVNAGFAGYAYPDWMKYFGFAVDYTYNRAVVRSQFISASVNGVAVNGNVNFLEPGSQSNGYVSALTFLFYGHYGFLPDSEVPSGRLHPYVGVGPAVVWTGIDIKDLATKTTSNVALVAEAGIRYMALPNVSLDLAFRYRYYTPSWDFSFPNEKVSLDATINSYSVLTRVAYHF
jgi:opacity protein-like surface antigen